MKRVTSRGVRLQGVLVRGLVCALAMIAAPLAHAQFAVIDVRAVAQLLTQVRMLEQQLATARDHLSQAQNEFRSMTGSRGMERLLSGAQRNYLPADWAAVEGVMGRSQPNPNPSFASLSGELREAMNDIAVLSAQQLTTLPQSAQRQLSDRRASAALLQVLTHQALATAGARFASWQQLIDAIQGATDQKAVLDLQARIAAEQGMLQNEQTKLQVLFRAADAEQWANQQREHEQAMVSQGQFATRFQPVP